MKEHSDSDADDQEQSMTTKLTTIRNSLTLALASVLFFLFTGAVSAQDGSDGGDGDVGFCDIEYIGPLLDTGFQLFIVGAFVIGLFTYVLTSFTDAFPLPQETKKQIKKHKNSAILAVFKVLMVPAIIVVLFEAMGIGVPDCVSIIPEF